MYPPPERVATTREAARVSERQAQEERFAAEQQRARREEQKARDDERRRQVEVVDTRNSPILRPLPRRARGARDRAIDATPVMTAARGARPPAPPPAAATGAPRPTVFAGAVHRLLVPVW